MAKATVKEKMIHPLSDRVLIQPFDAIGESTTVSGFILPGKEGSEKHERGLVVATGPGRFASDGKRIAMEIKKGDTVWFKRGYDAEEIKMAGKDLVLTTESNILAVEQSH